MGKQFEESIRTIRDLMRRGDARIIANELGCSKQVVFNALKKPNMDSMTDIEDAAFTRLYTMLIQRKAHKEEMTKKVVDFAESLKQ